MRYAIISDIHGNLAALDRVLQHIESDECDRIICLGDIVGYGPFPNECIDLVRQQCDIVLMGNHDHAAIGRTDTTYFNIYAKMAIDWTSAVLTPRSIDFLQGLDFRYSESDALFVHATPCEPEAWDYILSPFEALRNFECFAERVAFIGHSHVPVIFSLQGERDIDARRASNLVLKEDRRYIINVGSVGQPRDGNPKAAFAIYDDQSRELEMIRVEYDITATQKAMMDMDLPFFLVERLSHGQ